MASKRITVPRICEHCQTPFAARTDLIKIGRGQYCSRHCAGTAQRAKDRERSLSEFWLHVDKPDEPDACWTWTRACDGFGYGRFLEFLAHRHAFELAYGPIPKGMHVCHTCDNPACVRNDGEGWYELNGVLHPRRGHLWLGTIVDNTADKTAKGRGRAVRGEEHYHAILTWDAARAIRAAHANGKSQGSIAREYGVSAMTISDVIRGVTWIEPTSA